MLNMFLQAILTLALTIIFGGGIIMAAAVRPLINGKLSSISDPNMTAVIEEISIHAWNKYNRFAFFAALLLVLIDLIRLTSGLSTAYWHLGISLLMVVAFMRKFAIDKQLKNRLQSNGGAIVGSKEQTAGHRQVELLSKLILVASLILIILPV